MARKTNKAQVLELAAHLGVEVEYGPVGDGFEVALKDVGVWNTYGTGIRTEAGIWGAALRALRAVADRHSVPQDDEDLIAVDDTPDPAPLTPANPETVTTRYYVITDDDTDAEHTGSVIGNCEPFEAMRTMIGIVHNVSRETVRIWETDNYREYGFDAPHGRRGTARFLSVVETPLNPYK